MPELPDLQVFKKNLSNAYVGKTLKSITVRNKKKLKAPATTIKKALEGQELAGIERVGKELHFKFNNGNVLGVHLMLRGKFVAFDKKNSEKFTIVELTFDDGSGLALTDFQGQANITLNPEPRDAPDALSSRVNLAFLKKQLSTSKAVVKNVLLDQHILRGIGNAYADDILWDARISPFSISNKIPETAVRKLVKSIKQVLAKGEKNIMKSNPDIISGEVRDFMLVHNAKKEESPTGRQIQVKTLGGRKTYFTDEQKLFS